MGLHRRKSSSTCLSASQSMSEHDPIVFLAPECSRVNPCDESDYAYNNGTRHSGHDTGDGDDERVGYDDAIDEINSKKEGMAGSSYFDVTHGKNGLSPQELVWRTGRPQGPAECGSLTCCSMPTRSTSADGLGNRYSTRQGREQSDTVQHSHPSRHVYRSALMDEGNRTPQRSILEQCQNRIGGSASVAQSRTRRKRCGIQSMPPCLSASLKT